MNLNHIHHVAISVKDVSRAVEWYTKTFQCKIEYQDETWAMLAFHNIKIALVLPEQHPPHLAFVLPNARDFGALKLHRDGTSSVYVKDSEGNQLEFFAPDTIND